MKRIDLTQSLVAVKRLEMELETQLFKACNNIMHEGVLNYIANIQSICELTLSSLRSKILQTEIETNKMLEKQNNDTE